MLRFRLASYLLRETAWLYALGVAAFSLLLSIDFLSVWASFLVEYGVNPATVGQLMIYKTPYFLHRTLPIAAVFAVLLATGRLAKDSELKAAYSSGVPPLALLAPLLGFGLLVSGLTLVNNGWLEPRAETASVELVDSFLYARPSAQTRADVSYSIPDAGIYYAGRIRSEPANRDLADLSGINVILDDGTLYSAAQGTWNSQEKTWTLQDAQVLRPGRAPQQAGQVTLPFHLDSQAAATLTESKELTLSQLQDRLASARASGGASDDLAFSFQQRIADAFSALIFVLIAGTLGLNLHGRAAGFGWTIVLILIFYALYTLSGGLYEQHVLGPTLAAWFTAGVVGLAGVTLAATRLR
ncbi:MAG TPA: LptF/LptG family permease [Trueperaceae bacterium]